MMTGGDKSSLMSDINVTPFVDVMLVLLIIFMVTAPMMSQGVSVSLPEATSKPLPSDADQLIITINKDHQIFINDFQVSLDFLQEKLSKIIESRQNRDVYLRADKNISYGMVVRVMSEIKEAGVEKLGMVTEPTTSSDTNRKSGKGK
ncbi:MAG: protein TolR [Thermodesulfobacteriota bacterium]